MKREAIFEYALEQYGTKPDYPWPEQFPNYAVLRHEDGDKWYGLIMNVPKDKLGLKDEGNVEVIDLKCPPESTGSLRKEKGILPAYHMNKEHWISVLLDGSVSEDEVIRLLDDSYALTKK